jgi:transcription antitermination factor NusG
VRIAAHGPNDAMTFKLPDGVHWWAIKTRANFERTVFDQLRAKSFETFLPTYRVWSRRTDRARLIDRPLFPGYLFVHTDLSIFNHRVAVLRTRGLVRIIGGSQGPEPVRDSEIESIQILCASDRMLEPWSRLEAGQLVRIVSGGLAGATGVVVEVAGKGKRIVCNVELLGRAVAAELKADQVEPLNTR